MYTGVFATIAVITLIVLIDEAYARWIQPDKALRTDAGSLSMSVVAVIFLFALFRLGEILMGSK